MNKCQNRKTKAHWQTTMLGDPASSGIARYWTHKRVPTVSGKCATGSGPGHLLFFIMELPYLSNPRKIVYTVTPNGILSESGILVGELSGRLYFAEAHYDKPLFDLCFQTYDGAFILRLDINSKEARIILLSIVARPYVCEPILTVIVRPTVVAVCERYGDDEVTLPCASYPVDRDLRLLEPTIRGMIAACPLTCCDDTDSSSMEEFYSMATYGKEILDLYGDVDENINYDYISEMISSTETKS